MADQFRILLIDDNSDDRVLIRRALKQEFEALEVHEIGDAEALERALNTKPFDLVITDYNLGFTDGFTLLDVLKARWPDCPVILCTGTLSEEIAVAGLRKGLDDYVLKDPQHFLRMPAAVRNAVEHARQRAAVRAADVRYQALFEGAPVGLVRSLPDGRILAANPAAARIWGYPDVASFLRINSRELYTDPEDRGRLMAILESQDTVHNFEIHGRRGDGTLAWMSASVGLVRDTGGCVLHCEWSFQDITERKQLEAQLRQAQKIEAIGQLAGGIAHDFNNLLTVIAGRTYLLLTRLPGDDPTRRNIELIQKTAERATALTRQLLAFSRKQILIPQVLDLNTIVTGVEPILQRVIGENIILRSELDAAPLLVKVDSGQIEQVILNLAVNARDAMPEGGQLVIRTSAVSIDEGYARTRVGMQLGPVALLEVTDTGTGMTAEVRSHVFEPFFTTKPVGRGTGLGLSTVYGIVKQSGGYVDLLSEPGRGSTFQIYLPRAEEAEAAEPVGAPAARSTRGSETILLVEDEEEVRALAREFLALMGYTLLTAGDPAEAIRVSRGCAGVIHLLVTDVVMPGMSGRQLADQLVSERPGLKVLYMSGYTDDIIARHGVLESGISLVVKPFTPEGLSNKVREVLDTGE